MSSTRSWASILATQKITRSFEMESSNAWVTSVKSQQQESVSESVTDKGSQWLDLGPIKVTQKISHTVQFPKLFWSKKNNWTTFYRHFFYHLCCTCWRVGISVCVVHLGNNFDYKHCILVHLETMLMTLFMTTKECLTSALKLWLNHCQKTTWGTVL